MQPVKTTAYQGIIYMLLSALGFSLMAASAKYLKGSFNAGQLVFYRNLVGLAALSISLIKHPPENNPGGKLHLLLFRGAMGTVALYALLYTILKMPLGTAMSYNLTSTLFIALFSFVFLKEKIIPGLLGAVVLGFVGMLCIYRPVMDLPTGFHIAGLISGSASAIAYITVGRITRFYDARLIVLSFVGAGVIIPALFMLIGSFQSIPNDPVFFISFRWPTLSEWPAVLSLGLFALFGQYYITKAYGADKPNVVSAVSYSNIIFSVFLGMLLGDRFPDSWSWLGMLLIALSGIWISYLKKKEKA